MIRIYRVLLYLYPASFRREFGDDMTDVFARRAGGVGTARQALLLLAAVPEVVYNAVAAHGELLRQDLAFTLRGLRRSPLFAVTVVLLTALGVGANTAAFSVADFVLVQPLPFRDAESVVRLCAGPREGGGWGCNNQLTPGAYRDYREQSASLEALGAFQNDAVNLVGVGEPLRIQLARLTPEVFPILGVAPLAGSLFGSPSSGAQERAVVLGHGLWQTRFGGDPGVLGRSVSLDGEPYVVVAVMPEGFYFPNRSAQLWTPLHLSEEEYQQYGNNYLEAVGRLRDGVAFEEALADLLGVAERLRRDRADVYDAESGISFFRSRDEFSPRFRLMLQALVGASLCILVLACANLANLMLARAGARERELAVRAALGAGRERLVRQTTTEGVLLALLGGAVGVLIALLAIPLLGLLVPATLPIAERPEIDLRMLALAGAFTALTGLGFGLAPALRAGGHAALGALRTGARGGRGPRRGYRAALVSVQVSASVVLLISCGLLLRAVLRVQAVDPGFRTAGVLSVQTVLPKPEYLTLASREPFYREVLERVRALPEVEAAAYTSGLPMVLRGGIARVVLPGQEVLPDGDYSVSRRYVTPQLFRALGVPLLAGRDLEDADADPGDSTRVAVVSESFARRYWPEGEAVGERFLFQERLHSVVGVVGDVKVRGLERASEPQMYLPRSGVPEGFISIYDLKDLVIRSSGSPAALLPAVRDIVRSVDPDQPISQVTTLGDLLASETGPRRAQVRVLGVLAALALLLAGVGVYGLLAYTVAERQREIGVRMALGEEPGRVARRVIWDGLRLVLAGTLPGLALAYWAGRSLSSMLFGVPPADPTTLAAAVGVCVVTALVGATVPALRAVRVSPLTVIRSE
jgi:predicted permease